MKKTLFCICAVLFSLVGYAQTAGDIINDLEEKEGIVTVTSDNGIVSFNILSHVGCGFNMPSSDMFKKGDNSEYFINIAQVSIFPTPSFGFELNVDYNRLDFESTTSAFSQTNDHKIVAGAFGPILGEIFDDTSSTIRIRSISFPVLLKARIEDFEIGAGAEGFIPVSAQNNIDVRRDNRRIRVRETKAETASFNYAIVASMSYSQIGLYFKYYPKANGFLKEGSVPLDFWTIGICLGL